MSNKIATFLVGLLCLLFSATAALADTTMPPELQQLINQQAEQTLVEQPPSLASDYIADITYNLARDVQKLPNGNLLICRVGAWMPGVMEVDAQGQVVWSYYGIQANSARGLANGNILVADSGAPGAPYVPRILELNRDGKKVWEYVLPSLAYAPRYAERLSNGNTLLVLPFEIREITQQKKIVWQYGLGKPGKTGQPGTLVRPVRAHRLGNGNTLIVDRGHYKNGKVFEVTPGKKVVWQISAAANTTASEEEQKLPALAAPLDALRLEDGSTLITDKTQDQIFTVDAQGQIKQARSWAGLYKTAPVTDLWCAEPQADGNVVLAATMVSGRSRVAEVIGETLKVVWNGAAER
ncbi:hypothetical protein Dred_3106 [Desulforamulus reducens MI-1]|uniref:Uncharacterized protein n=1 Tax=Desulforamulus reducens (strain ATCC BAA-1160 / DSM 100696 / MI-1) TaxID=349161 RepID=A4J955_DESRM|nr:hypothetical protein [Desulforamulus reducens]ABO51608.1 hypothetical protein Dred_3106 [Desulforamulus reducens MI-1]